MKPNSKSNSKSKSNPNSNLHSNFNDNPNSQQAIISKIIESSFIDGPGHRMVIFFQGCNLNCIYCHNPETTGYCNLCFKCIKNCPTSALSKHASDINNNQIIFNNHLCKKCDLCIKNCPQSSNPLAYKLHINELIQLIIAEKDFINGITLSGGEATLWSAFIYNLFTEIKNTPLLKKLSLFIDTNGQNKQQVFKKLSSITDGFIFDLKAINPKIHKKITGTENKTILKNLKIISDKNLLYEIRTVFIEGVNDLEQEVLDILNFIKKINSYTKFKIIPFRPQGVRSDLQKSQPYPLKKIKTIEERAKAILGIDRVCVGN